MNVNDLRPAKQFARNFGVKAVVYGKPGAGKTPICVNTSPSPILLLSEPGALTLKNSDCPTYPAFTPAKIDDFFTWFMRSAEAKAFHTLVWDSASQGAEAVVDENLGGTTKGGNEQHGLRAYGKMARTMMGYLSDLYFMEQKHIILITKLNKVEENGVVYNRPYFPGRELNTRVPHLFDLVMCLGDWNIPGVLPAPTKAFKCVETFDYMARDRSGELQAYEPPDIGKIIAKCIQ